MKSTITAAAVALTLGTSVASAAQLTINGGNPGSIPDGSANDLLGPLGFGASLTGYFGSTITGSASSYRYDFLGFEAGAENEFKVGGSTVFDTSSGVFESGDPIETIISSVLDFAFLTSLSPLSVTEDDNNDNLLDVEPNYFASFVGDAKTGNVLYLFFDDTGAGDDDDHDDLAIRITAISEVPLPAPLALLVASLAGLGFLSFRGRNEVGRDG